MIEIKGETYLLATEAARHLKISRQTFYLKYKKLLRPAKVGQLNRKHYRLSQIEALNEVQFIEVA